MLTPQQTRDLEFATVHIDRVQEAVGSIKTMAPDEERVCAGCEYAARLGRWGIKTFGTKDPERMALVRCCPACETPVDLSADLG